MKAEKSLSFEFDSKQMPSKKHSSEMVNGCDGSNQALDRRIEAIIPGTGKWRQMESNVMTTAKTLFIPGPLARDTEGWWHPRIHTQEC
jgi:hypothetical protein